MTGQAREEEEEDSGSRTRQCKILQWHSGARSTRVKDDVE